MVAKRNIGRDILDGIAELKRGQPGRIAHVPSVSSVREKTGLSPLKFAALLGVSVRTLREWEQGRRAPSGAARGRGAGDKVSVSYRQGGSTLAATEVRVTTKVAK